MAIAPCIESFLLLGMRIFASSWAWSSSSDLNAANITWLRMSWSGYTWRWQQKPWLWERQLVSILELFTILLALLLEAQSKGRNGVCAVRNLRWIYFLEHALRSFLFFPMPTRKRGLMWLLFWCSVFAKLVPHMLNSDLKPVATLDDISRHLVWSFFLDAFSDRDLCPTKCSAVMCSVSPLSPSMIMTFLSKLSGPVTLLIFSKRGSAFRELECF